MGTEGRRDSWFQQEKGKKRAAEIWTLGLGIAVFTPPHHKSDKERDEADGGYDHGQEHILWGVREGGLHQGAVGKVYQVSLKDDTFCQGIWEAQPKLVRFVLQAILQVAVIPGAVGDLSEGRDGHREKDAPPTWKRSNSWPEPSFHPAPTC